MTYFPLVSSPTAHKFLHIERSSFLPHDLKAYLQLGLAQQVLCFPALLLCLLESCSPLDPSSVSVAVVFDMACCPGQAAIFSGCFSGRRGV